MAPLDWHSAHVASEQLTTTPAELLQKTAREHHDAFAATDGHDPDWPLWYAEHLHAELAEYTASELTRSRLVHCLVELADEYETLAPDQPWARFYAERLLERYGVPASPSTDRLALYHFETCPFCRRVRPVIDDLALDVELRDILADEIHRAALIDATARSTVPVLHITSGDGSERWLPGSEEIVRYLRATYGATS